MLAAGSSLVTGKDGLRAIENRDRGGEFLSARSYVQGFSYVINCNAMRYKITTECLFADRYLRAKTSLRGLAAHTESFKAKKPCRVRRHPGYHIHFFVFTKIHVTPVVGYAALLE